ncbi:GNAT family protein [Hydrogenovibrio kuenenii]|uniref:GNAT family N-acetyltransferase n=1 Tax=Hydrogenovibrio kuenenii TaxID=63658 RepID=UPI000466270F|nr:GNAT family N-acetyltransferase [Hydrogenovibrio kuenenii]
MANFEYKQLSEINLEQEFFDSLKEAYPEFPIWYQRKASEGECAYVLFNKHQQLDAFLYLKCEGLDENYSDIDPPFERGIRVKVGTLKAISRGTRLGERIIKKIIDYASESEISEVYVTVFDEHDHLIELLKKFGFMHWGKKTSTRENVLVKRLDFHFDDQNGNFDIYKSYPLVNTSNVNYWVLGIYPEFHTRMFPDSILTNESYELIQDVSETNTISKIYLTKLECISQMKRGDIILIYRTGDGLSAARYRAVVTSICIVDEIKSIFDFQHELDFMNYCEKGSVFTTEELSYFYRSKKYPKIIKLTYNIALRHRVTNGDLIDHVHLHPRYWGCFPLTKDQFGHIFKMGQANSNLLVHV